MKSILLVVLLAAAATAAVVSNEAPDVVKVPDVAHKDEVIDAGELTDGAEEMQTAIASRHNLKQEEIGSPRNSLFYDREVSAIGVPGRVLREDVTINPNRQITMVLVTRVGANQWATSSIIAGGVGNTFVSIRIRSEVGRGYHFRIQVYVR